MADFTLYGNDSAPVGSITYYASGGAPNFPAEQGSLVRDADGLMWEQRYPGLAQGWDLFSAHSPNTTILWTHENWMTSSLTSSTSGGGATPLSEIGTPSSSTDYWTCFRLRNTIRVLGLILPFDAFTGGTVTMKATIYECHTQTIPGVPWKPVSNVTWGLTNYSPAPEPVLVPYIPASTVPVVLRPGKYYIRHAWRNLFNGSINTRAMNDYSSSGTNNKFRTDRKRTATIDYDTVDMYTEISRLGGVIGSAATSGFGIINFGLWAEVLS